MKNVFCLLLLVECSLLFAQKEFSMIPKGNYTITNPQKALVFKFKLMENDILLDTKINGVPCKMFLDNGFIWDELYFFGSPVLDSLKLNYNNDSVLVNGQGSGQGITNKTANGLCLELENIRFTDQPAIISPPELGMQKLFNADGQISAQFFKNFITDINFSTMEITLHKPNYFVPGKDFESINLIPNGDGSFSVPVTINFQNKKIDTKLRIDLGGSCTFTYYYRKSDQLNFNGKKSQILGYGAQGELRGYDEKIESITIGKSTFTNIKGEFIESKPENNNMSILGMEILKNFHVILDYFSNKIYLKQIQKIK